MKENHGRWVESGRVAGGAVAAGRAAGGRIAGRHVAGGRVTGRHDGATVDGTTTESGARFGLLAAALALATLLAPASAAAQFGQIGGPDHRAEFFAFGDIALPVGEFHNHVDLGGGFGLGGAFFAGGQPWIAIRAEGTLVIYGVDEYWTRLSPTIPIDVEVQTNNSILSAGIGPQVYLATGSVRPYVFGTVGFSWFFTETSATGERQTEPFASSINFSDGNLAVGGGGGISVLVHQSNNPLYIDVSAAYQYNGLTEYLTSDHAPLRSDPRRGGSSQRWRDGHWNTDPIVSDGNLVTVRIGMTVGVG